MNGANVTKLALDYLQRNWARLVKNAYSEIESGSNMLAFLEDSRYCNSFPYFLARHLQSHFGDIRQGRCFVSLGGAEYSFKPCDFDPEAGAVLPPQELDGYAVCLAALAERNGMKQKFPLRTFQKYLQSTASGLSRKTCFMLSFAMGMDWDETCQFLSVMGEAPYQFRVLEECVYYCCQSTPPLNSWSTAQEILDRFHAQAAQPDKADLVPGQTELLDGKLTILSDELQQISDTESQISRILSFLQEYSPLMEGTSLSTYRLCMKKLDHVSELLNVKTDDELAIAMWSSIWIQFCRNTSKVGAQAHYDFVPFRNLMHIPKTLYEKPLWRARIRGLREKKLAPEKRDILFLSLMEWYWDKEHECGGPDNMLQFMHETNAELAKTSLSLIYPPNQYDRMILLAVSSEEPLDVLSNIFEAGSAAEAPEDAAVDGTD
jgi:hypothetical protein